MLNRKNILRKLHQNKIKLQQFGVKEIGLFGSYARNDGSSKSDIDILVEFVSGGKTFDHYMDLKFFLEDLFQKKVDLVIISTIKPALIKNIKKEVIYA